ncbi:LD-carboxypeptidase [Fulvivirgaceae bacterium PWU4]|uniref:LD-carboxypeptidase n=1 Tax=Chryseosolibacter histidini TaxID=2782349 RepID=A0AAP2DR70_9BACT|nr:LD-carboxypeptidase [Chryseosolibacter histidini]MBT1700039.1 LD-carboxypeptidase [Chryseosolibacter histidini]
MIIPSLLKTGDKVGIVATSRKIDAADVEFAAKVLESWGLQVIIGRNIFSSRHSYLAGADEERRADLQEMIDDAAIRAIICARGGYGSTRIIDSIDFSGFSKHPKWLVGFSDITALHLRLKKEQVASIHGTMPVLFSRPDSASSVESLRRLLLEGECSIDAIPSPFNRMGTASGMVTGGNLSLIVDSIGTSGEPDTKNCILVLEEIDEYFYKLDRMLTQLRRAGKLQDLRALVVGHMTDIKEASLGFGERVEEVILNAVKDYSYPVVFGFPSGHENPNYAWVHGGKAELIADAKKVSLLFEGFKKRSTV